MRLPARSEDSRPEEKEQTNKASEITRSYRKWSFCFFHREITEKKLPRHDGDDDEGEEIGLYYTYNLK